MEEEDLKLKKVLSIVNGKGWNLHPRDPLVGPVSNHLMLKENFTPFILVPKIPNSGDLKQFIKSLNNIGGATIKHPSEGLIRVWAIEFTGVPCFVDTLGTHHSIPSWYFLKVLETLRDISHLVKEEKIAAAEPIGVSRRLTFAPLSGNRLRCNQTGVIVKKGRTETYRRVHLNQ